MTRKWLALALIVLGVGLLASWTWAEWDRLAFEGRVSRGEEPVVSRQEALARLAFSRAGGADALTGRVLGTIKVPRLGIDEWIVHGTDKTSLRWGVGHVEGTPLPGQRGNVCLAGHRDTHFSMLKHIEPGDHILVETPDGEQGYQVDTTFVVTPDRSDLLDETPGDRLTLVTCYPFHVVGPAGKRFVVLANPE